MIAETWTARAKPGTWSNGCRSIERLAELTQSSNETIRLQSLREILDRLLGKPPVAIDATHTKLDVGQLYLAALKRANGVVDGGLNGSVDADQTETQ